MKKNIAKAIHQTLRKKDVYETDMHKIYNIILGQTNEQLQENAALESTSKVVKIGQDPIGYVMILRNL